MNKRLRELLNEKEKLELAKSEAITFYYKEYCENNGKVSDEASTQKRKAELKCQFFYKDNMREINELIIKENKKHNVYYDNEKWITDIIFKGLGTSTKSGQRLAKELVEKIKALNLNGVIVGECECGGYIRVFTPYKVYNYGFKRGYARSSSFEFNGSELFYPTLAKSVEELNEKYINRNKEE